MRMPPLPGPLPHSEMAEREEACVRPGARLHWVALRTAHGVDAGAVWHGFLG